MIKFKTFAAVIIMIVAAAAGFFIGAAIADPMGGAILFSMIAGIACVIYAIDHPEQ